MTGFASADAASEPFRLAWEVRSVNHRFLDIHLRLPDELRSLETECRDIVAASIRRGKIDCTLKVGVSEGAESHYAIDSAALTELQGLVRQVVAALPDARPLSVAEVLRWPNVLKEPQLDHEALAEPVRDALRRAVASLAAARSREGERIAELLLKRCDAIDELLASIRPKLNDTEIRYRRKLEERLARLDVQAQPERLEQELVLLAQRLDVTEELDRLSGHVTEVRDVLARDEPVGRRLDFLVQEMNREANTLGSKSQDEDLTRAAVDLKVLVEQMREQLQNLE